MHQQKKEQIDLIEHLFEKYGRVLKSKPYLNGKIQIEVFLDDSFSFLLNPKKYLNHIFNKNENFWSFLAGFTDAEGAI